VDEGRVIAGARGEGGKFARFEDVAVEYLRGLPERRNTTIGIVATNVDLTHEQLTRIVQVAHDGLAISISPAHMTLDGDTLFAASTAKIIGMREKRSIVDVVGYLAVKCVATAVARSVKAARSLSGVPGWGDF